MRQVKHTILHLLTLLLRKKWDLQVFWTLGLQYSSNIETFSSVAFLTFEYMSKTDLFLRQSIGIG